MLRYILVLAGTAAATLILTVLVRRLAVAFRVYDSPDANRKHHGKQVPLLGGLALGAGFWIAVVALLASGLLPDSRFTPAVLFGMFMGTVVLLVVGYLDDRYGLPPRLQILGPMAAAIIIIGSGIRISAITNPFGGVIHVGFFASLAFSYLWLMGMMYTTKLLDGLDGLVASLTGIGALIIFGLSLTWDVRAPGTTFLALALAGCCLGFLPFNVNPAKIFLGEGGSVLTGCLLGVLAIASGSKIATTLLVMGVPVLDAAWVIIERVSARRSPLRADRRHLHYRLLAQGFTVRQVVAILSLTSAAFGVVALVASPMGKAVALGGLVIMVVFLLPWVRRSPEISS